MKTFSQEIDYDLDEILVRADLQSYFADDTRNEKLDSLSAAGYSLLSLSEALALQGALVVSSYGSRGSLSGVKLRGTGDNHTRFNWNGIPVNSLTTGTMDASLIPAGFMQDIFINRGASGAIAGNSSFGGAIYLENKAVWEERLRITLDSEAGSFGYRALMPSLQVSGKKVQYRVSFQAVRAINDFPFVDKYKPSYPVEHQVNDTLSQWGVIQNLFIRLKGNIQLEGGVWLTDKEKDIPPVMGSYTLMPSSQADRGLKTYLRFSKTFRSSSLKLQAGYTNDSLHYSKYESTEMVNLLIDSRIQTSSFFTGAEWRWFLNSRLSLDLAGRSEHPRAVVGSYPGIKREDRFSLISAAKYRLRGWVFNLGLRKEFNPYNPPGPLASFGVSWKSKDMAHLIRANLSNKFRIPSFNERYWQPGGNPYLLAEDGWGGELGWRFEKMLKGGFSTVIEPVVFYQRINNWIQWVPGAEYFYPRNQDLMLSRGLELGGQTSRSLNNIKLDLIYKYSYTKAGKASSGDQGEFSRVIYVPYHQSLVGLKMKYGKLSSSVIYNFQSERTTTDDANPIYSLRPLHIINLGMEYKRSLNDTEFTVYTRLNNILNYQYQIIRSYATPGISWTAGLRINFVKLQANDKD